MALAAHRGMKTAPWARLVRAGSDPAPNGGNAPAEAASPCNRRATLMPAGKAARKLHVEPHPLDDIRPIPEAVQRRTSQLRAVLAP